MAARTAARVARRVVFQALATQTELKRLDLNFAVSPTIATPQILWPTQLVGGSSYFQRIGTEVRLRQLVLHWTVLRNAAAVAPTQLVRVVVYIDTQVNGTAPTMGLATDLFSVNPSLTEQRTPNTGSRFVVLRDKVISVSTGQATYRQGRWIIPLRAVSHWLDAANLITSALTNQVYILVVGSDAANGAQFTVSTRLHFRDM